jgi:hypothetical protein
MSQETNSVAAVLRQTISGRVSRSDGSAAAGTVVSVPPGGKPDLVVRTVVRTPNVERGSVEMIAPAANPKARADIKLPGPVKAEYGLLRLGMPANLRVLSLVTDPAGEPGQTGQAIKTN